MQIFETGISEFSGFKCKIQMRCNHGIWFQRHVWYPCDNPAYDFLNYYREDEWIKSGTGLSAPDKRFRVVEAQA